MKKQTAESLMAVHTHTCILKNKRKNNIDKKEI